MDHIFRSAALAAADARIPLAKMAVAETGMGVLEDKVIKNHFASEYIYNKYKDDKTCGVLAEDDTFGTITIAEPVGLICGIVPTTNPTSTAIFKALISLKTRNGIIFSPHPRAKRSTCEAARLVLQAAVSAGAPPDIIGWIDEPSVALSNQLMHHPDLNLILATGGGHGARRLLLRQARHRRRRRQHPGGDRRNRRHQARGRLHPDVQDFRQWRGVRVGAVRHHRRRHLRRGAAALRQTWRLHSVQTRSRGGAQGDPAGRRLNAAIVGQSAARIAEMAGIEVPPATKVLIGEVSDVSAAEAFAHEKLSPTLAMYRAGDFVDACDKAAALVAMGGIGHTSALYTDQDLQGERIRYFGDKMKTARILINTPSSQGGIGDLTTSAWRRR